MTKPKGSTKRKIPYAPAERTKPFIVDPRLTINELAPDDRDNYIKPIKGGIGKATGDVNVYRLIKQYRGPGSQEEKLKDKVMERHAQMQYGPQPPLNFQREKIDDRKRPLDAPYEPIDPGKPASLVLERMSKKIASLPTRIDVNSEGFDQLPEHMQKAQLKRVELERQAERIGRREFESIIDEMRPLKYSERTHLKLEHAKDLITANPHLPAKFILHSMQLSEKSYRNFVAKRTHQPPKKSKVPSVYTPEVIEIFKKIFYDSNCTFGRYKMCAALRQYNINLGHVTVRKRMADWGLVVVRKKADAEYIAEAKNQARLEGRDVRQAAIEARAWIAERDRAAGLDDSELS